MDIGSLFRLSPADSSFLKIIHTIGSVTAFVICFIAIGFTITLLCMVVLQAMFELVFRLAEFLLGNYVRENQEIMDLESGISVFRGRRFSLVRCDSWPQSKEREGRRQNPLDRLLPLVAYKDGETCLKAGDSCAICLDDYRNGELCRVLSSCKHMFHSSCVDPWFNKSLTCPVCRQHLFDERGGMV